MREQLLKSLTLICPACRKNENGAIKIFPLELSEVFLKEKDFILEGMLCCSNPQCNKIYPIISGVPIILKDMASWWKSEKTALSNPDVASQQLNSFFQNLEERDLSDLVDNAFIGTYVESHFGESLHSHPVIPKTDTKYFNDAVLQSLQPQNGKKLGKSLDMGCAVGGYTFAMAQHSDLAIGLDTCFPAVRMAAEIQRTNRIRYPKMRRHKFFQKISYKFEAPQNAIFLTADAMDPPFEAETFDLVAGLNIIENVKIPLVLLGQMDALLKKSGIMLFSSPYEWQEAFSNSEEWLETEAVDAASMIKGILTGNIFPQTKFSYDIITEKNNILWPLRHHDRYSSVYQVHLLEAKKQK